MADCHDLFLTFLDTISLSATKQDYLKAARNAVRDKIRNHFKSELKKPIPRFRGQGSYAMRTLITPLDGEYDIDDGVYLQGLDKDSKDDWPPPETAHKWVYDAVKGHTDKDPVDKRTCVRVVYAKQYHVDLPIYAVHQTGYHLAEKGDAGWHVSDPLALTQWFDRQVKEREQLRGIVRYLKAWADFSLKNGSQLSGPIFTVLASNNYQGFERDDVCFSKVAKNIYTALSTDFTIRNPVDPNEILSDRLTGTQKTQFKTSLSLLLQNAGEALKKDDKKAASVIWRDEVFGDRFPVYDDGGAKKKEPLVSSGPALLRNDARSA